MLEFDLPSIMGPQINQSYNYGHLKPLKCKLKSIQVDQCSY